MQRNRVAKSNSVARCDGVERCNGIAVLSTAVRELFVLQSVSRCAFEAASFKAVFLLGPVNLSVVNESRM